MPDFATLLGGGAVIGVLIAGWNYVKIYLTKIYSLFFVRLNVTDGDLDKAAYVFLLEKCIQSRFSLRTFTMFTNFVKPIGKNQSVGYEVPTSEPSLFWYKNKPFIYSDGTITFFRFFMFDANKLMIDIMETYNNKMGDSIQDNRFFIQRFTGTLDSKNKFGNGQMGSPVGVTASEPRANDSHQHHGLFAQIQTSLKPIKWGKDDIGQMKRPDPISYLALSNDCLKAVEDVKLWRKSEEWYKSKQIPHKKGLLFYGPPGTGKSSLAKALAMELNMPIMTFDLTNMSNSDFQTAWNSVKGYSPCMVLLEDIDAVFHGRENVAHDDGGLSFDCLLNNLDGVEASDGLLIIATTNDIDKIDPALGKPNGNEISTRPGRIDRAIELLAPDQNGRLKIANRILSDYPDQIEYIVEAGKNDSGAQFQERCSRLALSLFWNEKNNDATKV